MKFIGTLLGRHLARYPRMQLTDVYKLLHQAALGSSHAVAELAAREQLEQEIAQLGEGPDEPLLDVISPDARLARIHLRAFARSGHRSEELIDAFSKTARAYPPSRERLERFLACLGDLAAQGTLPFTREQAVQFAAHITRENFPVVHHSQEYRALYHPAYRVVDTSHLAWARGAA